MKLLKQLQAIACGEIKEDIDLSKYTSYKIKAKAQFLIVPKNIDQLKKLLHFLKENQIKHMIVGGGSNIVFTKDYYNGVLISLREFNDLKINDQKVQVGSGYYLKRLAYLLARRGLCGLEFAAGIPGTLGGAVYMNAGAYDSAMSNVVDKIIVLTPELEIKELTKKDLHFAYRSSWLQKNKDFICLQVFLNLEKGSADDSLLLIEDRKKRRLLSQPLNYPSAGSVFRNPPNDYAGRLIEELGLKGYQIGDAKVSCKHANFIININHASGTEIKELIETIKAKVFEKYKIDLIVEQEFID